MKNSGDYKTLVKQKCEELGDIIGVYFWMEKVSLKYGLYYRISGTKFKVVEFSGPKPLYDWLCGYVYRVKQERI